MATIQVTVDGRRLLGYLQRIEPRMKTTVTEVLDKAAAVLLNRIRTRFLREQDPDGNKWPESRSAQIRKAGGYTVSNGRRVTGGGTLFATGTLFHSIQAHKTPRFGERRIGFDRIKAPYGADHQLGIKGQVKRPFIGFNNQDTDFVAKLIRKQVARSLG